MSIPQSQVNTGSSNAMAVNSSAVPTEATSSDTGAYVSNVMCEIPQSGSIGVYRFDFTRLLARTLGSNWTPTAGNPYKTILGLFKSIKFGRGYMRINRVDAGGRAAVMTIGTSPPITLPYSEGDAPLDLKIHYIRMNSHEASWFQVLQDGRKFMADHRRRTVTLKPNRSVTFSFTPLSFRPARYLAHTIRDYSNTIAEEQDAYRRVELPSRGKRLGWIPTTYAGFTNYTPTSASESNPGLGASEWRIVSNTLAIMFEIDANGVYQIPSSVSGTLVTPALWPYTTTVGNITGPVIRRSEHCSVRLRGIVDTVHAEDGVTPYANVGKIYTTHAWNSTGGFTTTPNVAECFDPPRFHTVLTELAGTASGPLWRAASAPDAWQSFELPLDTELALIASATSIPSVPPGNAAP